MSSVTQEAGSSAEHASSMPARQVAQAIDHTKLTFKPGEDAEESIRTLCREAVENGFYAVCVRPQYIRLAKACIGEADVKVATVIGFPHQKVTLLSERENPTVGVVPLQEKLAETQEALREGADELDLVMNLACFKSEVAQQTGESLKELQTIQHAAQGRPVKVIVETDLLSDDEVIRATQLCLEAGVAMIKTSTGMIEDGQGATLHAVKLMHETIRRTPGASMQIKASGGIRTARHALDFLQAGVTRLGTSAGADILQNL